MTYRLGNISKWGAQPMDLNDLAIVGNCQYSALIDRRARVVWLCWPRFDSSPVFAKLLDERGGAFAIGSPDPHTRVDQSYLQNTNILRTEFKNGEGRFEVIDFAPRFMQSQRSFHPAMLVRIVRPLEGKPKIGVEIFPTYDYGRVEPRAHWGSHHIEYEGLPGSLRLTTTAPFTYIEEKSPFALTRPQYFVLAWGAPFEAPIAETCEAFYESTKRYWESWVKHCTIPPIYQEAVIRSALVLKLHQYEDTGAIIAATTTSIPEAPGTARTWDYRYCWLRDTYFTLSALQYLGQFEEMEAFSDYLRNIGESDAGRLQPLYGIGGKGALPESTLEHLAGYRGHGPVRVGNDAYAHIQNDIYGEVILALSPLFLDRRFVFENLDPPRELLSRLLAHIAVRLEEPDAGVWEFRDRSRLHTFTLLMHWLGAKTAARIGEAWRWEDLAQRARSVQARAAHILDTACWSPSLGCYVQAAGTEDLDASLFMMINSGFLSRASPRAESHLSALHRVLSAENGLIYRYVHRDDFGRSPSTFTICGFWYIEALARLGHLDRAKALFEQYLGYANPAFLFGEDLDPVTLEQWGNFPQTYSHVGLVNAAFKIAHLEEALR